MDTNVVELERPAKKEDLDCFLLDEGLEILAAYRSIRDKSVRLSLKQLILSLAGADFVIG